MFLLAYDENEGTHGRGRARRCRRRRRRRSANEEGRTRVQSPKRRQLCRRGADLQRGRGRAQGEGRKEVLEGGRQGLMRGRGARHRIGSQWRRDSALAMLLMLKRSSHLHCTCARSHAPTSKSAGQREPRNDRCHAMLGHWAPCLPLHEVHGMNVLASSGTSAPERRQKCPSCFASPRAAIQPPFLPPSVTYSLCGSAHTGHLRRTAQTTSSRAVTKRGFYSKPFQTWVNEGVISNHDP